jgi:hypothetical protein
MKGGFFAVRDRRFNVTIDVGPSSGVILATLASGVSIRRYLKN